MLGGEKMEELKGGLSLKSHLALLTDYYQLRIAQGYFFFGMVRVNAVFDYFFQENPFNGGYVIFAGLSDLLEFLESLRFEPEEIEHLRFLGFKEEFLSYLENFHFGGTIYSVKEGEVVFPLEPVVRVEGNVVETQLIETILLNILNYQSLVATKASRMRYAAGNCKLIDFGLRSAQGLGGIHGSKAAIIGGFDATSNVYSALCYSLNLVATQSHLWIQSFGDELTAFRKYAELYPDDCILVVDTYNTLRSGLPNAIKVAKEMEMKGHKLRAVILDSGDLEILSKKVRAMLDSAGLNYVQIMVSNQLDEYQIRNLIQQNASIDIFAVGTRLITGHNHSTLHAAYKPCVIGEQPVLKFYDNFLKTTLPGRKKVIRFFDSEGKFDGDGIVLETDENIEILYNPVYTEQFRSVNESSGRFLMSKVMENGSLLRQMPTVEEIKRYATNRLVALPSEYRRLDNPKQYEVGISPSLMRLRSFLFEQMRKGPMPKQV